MKNNEKRFIGHEELWYSVQMKAFFQKTLPVGQLMCNCQLLVCPETYEAVLVDPGDEPERILAEIKKAETQLGAPIQLKALFHTHAHFDHVGATRGVKEYFLKAGIEAPQIYLHQGDEFMYQMLAKQGQMFGFQMSDPLPIDQFLNHEQVLQFGKMKFSIIHTPGHSPGGVSFRLHEDSALNIPETVFTGDTLFRESVGRTDLWGADGNLMIKTIHERLLTLDGDTRAWPGHGMPTTIGHERLKNPYL